MVYRYNGIETGIVNGEPILPTFRFPGFHPSALSLHKAVYPRTFSLLLLKGRYQPDQFILYLIVRFIQSFILVLRDLTRLAETLITGVKFTARGKSYVQKI